MDASARIWWEPTKMEGSSSTIYVGVASFSRAFVKASCGCCHAHPYYLRKPGSRRLPLSKKFRSFWMNPRIFSKGISIGFGELFECAGITVRDLSDRPQMAWAQSSSKPRAEEPRGRLPASALKEKLSDFFEWLVALAIFAISMVALGFVGQLSVTKSLVGYCSRLWPLGFDAAFIMGGLLWFVVRLGLRRAVWRYAWTIYRRKAGRAFIECATVVITAVALWALEAALIRA